MDHAVFLAEFVDYLAPRLDTYEQTIYLYVVRHSRLSGSTEAVIGFKSARKEMGFGIGQSGSPMSESVCYEKLRSLEKKGCVKIFESQRSGTRIQAFLPSEIPGLVPLPEEEKQLLLEEMDFFEEADNRLRILAREDGKCFYCKRAIGQENYVIEHVVSRPVGDNTYRNLVAACRQCNNRKGGRDVEEHCRNLYRDSLLSADEFRNVLTKLQDLKGGKLVPPVT